MLSINELKENTFNYTPARKRSSFAESASLIIEEKELLTEIDRVQLSSIINNKISSGEAVRWEGEFNEKAEENHTLWRKVGGDVKNFVFDSMDRAGKMYEEDPERAEKTYRSSKAKFQQAKKGMDVIKKGWEKVGPIILKIITFIRDLIRKFIAWVASKFSAYERFLKEIKKFNQTSPILNESEDIKVGTKIHIIKELLTGESLTEYNNVIGRWYRGLHMLGKMNNYEISKMKMHMKSIAKRGKEQDKKDKNRATYHDFFILPVDDFMATSLPRIQKHMSNHRGFMEFVINGDMADMVNTKEDTNKVTGTKANIGIDPYKEVELKDIESQFDFGQYCKAFYKSVEFFVKSRRKLHAGGEWNRLSKNIDDMVDIYNKNTYHLISPSTPLYVNHFKNYLKFFKEFVKYTKTFDTDNMLLFQEDLKTLKANSRPATNNDDKSHFGDPDPEIKDVPKKARKEKGGFGGYLENKGGKKDA